MDYQEKINQQVMEKLDQLNTKLGDVCNTLEALPSKLTLELDNRYASKRTEIAVDRIGWLVIILVLTTIIGGIVYIK